MVPWGLWSLFGTVRLGPISVKAAFPSTISAFKSPGISPSSLSGRGNVCIDLLLHLLGIWVWWNGSHEHKHSAFMASATQGDNVVERRIPPGRATKWKHELSIQLLCADASVAN